MEIKKVLADFRKKLDKEIERYFDEEIKYAQDKDPLVSMALEYAKVMVLSGGKRLRPALMQIGYRSVGGKDLKRIIRASASIELVHIFLLMHDDVIDRDNLRHGVDSMNYYFEKFSRKNFPERDACHFGNSMAIIIGDTISALGNKIILRSGFSDNLIAKTLSRLQEIIALTVIGQAKDVHMEHRGSASEKEILKMYEYKTARYTVEGPLHLGMILGGAKKKDLEKMSQYATAIGIAFQIQDDILGIFGEKDSTGKSVSSDIERGKQTILLVKALELGNFRQKKELRDILAKKKVGREDIENFKNIIVRTGSLEYANKLAKNHIRKGKNVLEKMRITRESKEFLLGLADFMISRTS